MPTARTHVDDQGFVELLRAEEGWTEDDVRDVAEAWGVLWAYNETLTEKPDRTDMQALTRMHLLGWVGSHLLMHKGGQPDPRFAALGVAKADEARDYYLAELRDAVEHLYAVEDKLNGPKWESGTWAKALARIEELTGYLYSIWRGQEFPPDFWGDA